MPDKWVERWAIPSNSGPGSHIVGKDKDGNYGCDCIGWTRSVLKKCLKCGYPWAKNDTECFRCGSAEHTTERRDCSHILQVKEGRGKTIGQATIDRMMGR